MKLIIHWLLSALAILIAAFILPGVMVSGIFTALVLAAALGLINAVLKPVLVILTLPINILTLGLFTLVIDAVLIILAAQIVQGFRVDGFLSAILFAVVLAIVSAFLHGFEKSA